MAREKGSVLYYTEGIATFKVKFPENEVNCLHCPFCRKEGEKESLRYYCQLLRDLIISARDVRTGRVCDCPIDVKGDIE